MHSESVFCSVWFLEPHGQYETIPNQVGFIESTLAYNYSTVLCEDKEKYFVTFTCIICEAIFREKLSDSFTKKLLVFRL